MSMVMRPAIFRPQELQDIKPLYRNAINNLPQAKYDLSERFSLYVSSINFDHTMPSVVIISKNFCDPPITNHRITEAFRFNLK